MSIYDLQDICGQYSNNGEDCFFFGTGDLMPCSAQNCPMGSCLETDFRRAGEKPEPGCLMVDEKMLP